MTIFVAISKIADTIYNKNKLNFPETEKTKEAIETVKNYFGINNEEALILSYFIYRKIEECVNYFTVDDVNRDVNVSVTESLSYLPVLDSLIKKKCLCLRDKIKLPENFQLGRYDCFDVDEELIDLISYNTPFTEYHPKYSTHKYSARDLIATLDKTSIRVFKSSYLLQRFMLPYQEDKWVHQLLIDTSVISGNKSSEIWENNYHHLKLFLLFAKKLWSEKNVSIKEALEEASISVNDTIEVLNEFKTEKSPLLKKGYLEIDKADIADNIKVEWGPKVKEAFKGYEELLIQDQQNKELQRISVKSIKEKTLFYNEANQKDVDRLTNIVEDKNYNDLRKRLKDKGLPLGLTILLYGAPGTGKTETVMQLAKKTGRDVFHLNIEQVRSCWVGESEKNIKEIFKAYYSSKSKKKPILLFNEADAIISKRTSVDGANSSVTKMENAIQNLLLEELEKFDGIFIATTNIITEIDEAFDRRLLFKLKFENPTVAVKEKIWKSRLDWLDDDAAHKLSAAYDLSGGQIENVYRKSEIDYLLYGKKPTTDDLLDFCKKEKLNGQGASTLGFHI